MPDNGIGPPRQRKDHSQRTFTMFQQSRDAMRCLRRIQRRSSPRTHTESSHAAQSNRRRNRFLDELRQGGGVDCGTLCTSRPARCRARRGCATASSIPSQPISAGSDVDRTRTSWCHGEAGRVGKSARSSVNPDAGASRARGRAVGGARARGGRRRDRGREAQRRGYL